MDQFLTSNTFLMPIWCWILLGFFIGFLISKFWEWHIKTYGVDGKAETEKYMADKYGDDWFEQMFNTNS